MQQIEQIIFGNVGNRITRELAAGLFLAISERFAAQMSEMLEANQAVEEPDETSGPDDVAQGAFPAPRGVQVPSVGDAPASVPMEPNGHVAVVPAQQNARRRTPAKTKAKGASKR